MDHKKGAHFISCYRLEARCGQTFVVQGHGLLTWLCCLELSVIRHAMFDLVFILHATYVHCFKSYIILVLFIKTTKVSNEKKENLNSFNAFYNSQIVDSKYF